MIDHTSPGAKSKSILGVGAAATVDLDAVRKGRKASRIVAERISRELPELLDPADRTEFRLDRDHARTVGEDLRQIEVDLIASGSVVARLSTIDVAELAHLSADLEEAVVRSKLRSLALNTVVEILKSATRIKDIIHA
jgi:hypothetical protein